MTMLDGELRRAESQYVRVFRPGGREQVATGRLLVDPREPTAAIALEANRSLPNGEYMINSMGGARRWPVILKRTQGKLFEVHRLPPTRAGLR